MKYFNKEIILIKKKLLLLLLLLLLLSILYSYFFFLAIYVSYSKGNAHHHDVGPEKFISWQSLWVKHQGLTNVSLKVGQGFLLPRK